MCALAPYPPPGDGAQALNRFRRTAVESIKCTHSRTLSATEGRARLSNAVNNPVKTSAGRLALASDKVERDTFPAPR